jgi:hypothetical protein
MDIIKLIFGATIKILASIKWLKIEKLPWLSEYWKSPVFEWFILERPEHMITKPFGNQMERTKLLLNPSIQLLVSNQWKNQDGIQTALHHSKTCPEIEWLDQ